MPPENSEASRWFFAHVQPHEGLLRAWLRGQFPRLGDIDDVVQEAFVRVLQAHETQAIESPKAFLFATARNLALGRMRHEKVANDFVLAETSLVGVSEESVNVADEVARAQELELLTQAIQSLPARCRQIITLRRIYGLSQKEVAAQLGIAEHTVEAQGTIGLRKLTEYFERLSASRVFVVSEISPNDPVPEAIAQAAAAWVLRCDRGLTAVEQDEFSDWLAGDPRHGEQLARHRRHWQRLEALAQWRPEHSARPSADLLAPPRARWTRYWPAAVGLAAAAAVAVILWNGGAGSAERATATPADARVAEAEVDAGAVSRRTLADGTVVELNRGAVLTEQFSAGERRVRLEQGEAHFAVTKDAARPFVVSVQGMDVRAVGTAFNVRLDRAAVEVLVTEGRVRVSEASAGPDARGETGDRPTLVPLLEAGQRAVVSLAAQPEAPQIATLTTSEIERVLAWQRRMLEFTAAPLGEIVAEFNRRNAVQIIVVDAELAAIRISASFRSDNIDGFVRLVEMGFGARAERNGANEIRLRRAR